MAIDQSLKVQNSPSGNLTIQGSVVGPQGNHASIGAAPQGQTLAVARDMERSCVVHDLFGLAAGAAHGEDARSS